MNQDYTQQMELDFKDLILFIFRKLGTIIVVSLICTIIFGGYAILGNTSSGISVLDVSTQLSNEDEQSYRLRVLNVNRANDIVSSVNTINSLIESRRSYITNSVFMQIDPENEAVSSAQIAISIDESELYLLNALYDAYKQDIISGAYLSSISDEFGFEEAYLKELISVDYYEIEGSPEESIFIDTNSGALVVTVIGPSNDLTESILDCVLDEIENKSLELNECATSYEVHIVGRQSYISVDSDTREAQIDIISDIELLEKKIDDYNKTLDVIAKDLGISGRIDFYTYFNSSSDYQREYNSGALKYALIGFVIGLILSVGIYSFKYVFGKKVLTQTQFFSLFPSIPVIGVMKPHLGNAKKHNIFELLSGDDTRLETDKVNELIAANLDNLTKDSNRIIFTGTAQPDAASAAIKTLKRNVVLNMDMFNNPSVLNDVREYDGVVLIEQRNVSEKNTIIKEIELLNNSGTKILGAIII